MSRVVIAVVGSRKFPRRDMVEKWMAENWDERWHVISGGASGVDLWVEAIAAIHGDSPERIAPDWKRFPAVEYGKDFAPKFRNREIARACDRMVAFWDGRSTGTSHAIAWAHVYGKPVTIFIQEER